MDEIEKEKNMDTRREGEYWSRRMNWLRKIKTAYSMLKLDFGRGKQFHDLALFSIFFCSFTGCTLGQDGTDRPTAIKYCTTRIIVQLPHFVKTLFSTYDENAVLVSV